MYFAPGFRPPDRTQFESVYSVPPGYYLTADIHNIALTQYWDTNYPTTQSRGPVLADAEYIAGFRSILDEAVRMRLRADVPVGCYLSGGLDSCAVLGLAAKHRTDPIRAFTLRFDHEEYDEGAIAKEMASKAGADWEPIPITQDSLADSFSDAVYHAESPWSNGHGVAKYLLSRAVRDAGFKVVLTGEGSDEVLAGYPHFRHDMLLHDSPDQDPAELERRIAALADANKVSRGLLLPDEPSDGSLLMRRLLGFTPAMFMPMFAGLQRLAPLLNADYLAPFQDLDRGSLLLNSLDVKG